MSTQRTSLTTILALVGAGAGVTLVPAMSLAGPWVTDSGIALRREKSGTAKRSVPGWRFRQVVFRAARYSRNWPTWFVPYCLTRSFPERR